LELQFTSFDSAGKVALTMMHGT